MCVQISGFVYVYMCRHVYEFTYACTVVIGSFVLIRLFVLKVNSINSKVFTDFYIQLSAKPEKEKTSEHAIRLYGSLSSLNNNHVSRVLLSVRHILIVWWSDGMTTFAICWEKWICHNIRSKCLSFLDVNGVLYITCYLFKLHWI